MSDEPGDTDETRRRTLRRRFLALAAAGATTGLAGCGGGGGGGEESPTEGQSPTATETGGATSTGTGGGGTGTPESVPSEYETATSQGGTQRDPSALSTKASVQYQSQPNDGQQCSNCQFYIPDKNGDGRGACAVVEGLIDPEGWCVSYAALQTDTETG